MPRPLIKPTLVDRDKSLGTWTITGSLGEHIMTFTDEYLRFCGKDLGEAICNMAETLRQEEGIATKECVSSLTH